MAFGEQPKNHLLIDDGLKRSINLIQVGLILLAVKYLVFILALGNSIFFLSYIYLGTLLLMTSYAVINIILAIVIILLDITSFVLIIIGFIRYSKHFRGVYQNKLKKSLIFYICYAIISGLLVPVFSYLSLIFYSGTPGYIILRSIAIILGITSYVLFTLFFDEMRKSFNEMSNMLGIQNKPFTPFYLSIAATMVYTLSISTGFILDLFLINSFAISLIFVGLSLIVNVLIGVSLIMLISSFKSIDTFAIANMVQQPIEYHEKLPK